MPSNSAETETKTEYPLGSMEVYEPSGYSALEAKEIYLKAEFFERRGNSIHEFLESESGEPGMVVSSDDDTKRSTGCYGRFCALHCGAQCKHSKAMRLCMSMGSAVSLPASKGTTPLLLGTEAISRGHVGNDFWCIDLSDDSKGTFWLQGRHVVHGAYNSWWMSNFIYPNWDMSQSTHPCVEFHAATRAISGEPPSYINNSVGNPNFSLLKSWVLSYGSILRCELYALPTRDCLFEDPLQAGKTMLKLWNLNKFTGAPGAFNYQGGGWSRETVVPLLHFVFPFNLEDMVILKEMAML
ncbi:hypothetical protein Nepgr_022302 [Nepenthes gracilis]|uniref:Uncharacterized protein n=1 Tax=Nepenthes gracilis TaxID=150966 RepID=A0AAD3XY91_NEPGR|nr:hypothetical protein Nepgr_022302 [Nepenthes gracilis]